jgi:hypothetical protein
LKESLNWEKDNTTMLTLHCDPRTDGKLSYAITKGHIVKCVKHLDLHFAKNQEAATFIRDNKKRVRV